MAFQTGLEGKPFYWGLIAGLVVGGGLLWGAHKVFLSDMEAGIVERETKLAELNEQVEKGRRAERLLPQFRAEVAQLEADLERLLRILPARRNTPELLRQIRGLTEQGDFNILRFDPRSFVDRGFYDEWPINISLEGGYHNLARFFDEISRLSRIYNIHNLQLRTLRQRRGDSRPGHTLSADFQALTFIYKDPPPVADEETEEQGAAR